MFLGSVQMPLEKNHTALKKKFPSWGIFFSFSFLQKFLVQFALLSTLLSFSLHFRP